MIDQLGHLFYFFIFIGTYLVANKNQTGWVLRFLGEAGWTVLGFILGLSSIWIWGIVFLANDAYGYFKWRNNSQIK